MLDKKVSRCLVMNDFLLFSDRYVLVEGGDAYRYRKYAGH